MEKKSIKEMFEEAKNNKRTWLPNILTSSRILSSIITPVLFLTGNYMASFGFLIYGGISDCLDGIAARALDGYSDFGKNLDALSDKIFAGSLALCVIPTSPVILMNIALELGIGLTNLKSFQKGNDPESSKIGKVKTWLLFGSLGLCFLNKFLPGFNVVANTACLATGAIEAVTLYDYQKKEKKKDAEKAKEVNETKLNIDEKEDNITGKAKEKELEKSDIAPNITDDFNDINNITITEEEQNKKEDKPKVLVMHLKK